MKGAKHVYTAGCVLNCPLSNYIRFVDMHGYYYDMGYYEYMKKSTLDGAELSYVINNTDLRMPCRRKLPSITAVFDNGRMCTPREVRARADDRLCEEVRDELHVYRMLEMKESDMKLILSKLRNKFTTLRYKNMCGILTDVTVVADTEESGLLKLLFHTSYYEKPQQLSEILFSVMESILQESDLCYRTESVEVKSTGEQYLGAETGVACMVYLKRLHNAE